jgi:hypothetical protein
VGHRLSHGAAVPADLHAGEVERVEHQLDLAPDERGIDLVGVPP